MSSMSSDTAKLVSVFFRSEQEMSTYDVSDMLR